jgi:hypothetical protein
MYDQQAFLWLTYDPQLDSLTRPGAGVNQLQLLARLFWSSFPYTSHQLRPKIIARNRITDSLYWHVRHRRGDKMSELKTCFARGLACIEDEVKFRTDRFGTEPGADQPLFTNRYGSAIQQDSRITKGSVRESESSLHHASFFEAFLRECAQGSEAGYRGDFAISRPRQSDRHSEHLSSLERRSSAWPGAGNPSSAASNRKVAKKCKILKMGLSPMGGVGLSL